MYAGSFVFGPGPCAYGGEPTKTSSNYYVIRYCPLVSSIGQHVWMKNTDSLTWV